MTMGCVTTRDARPRSCRPSLIPALPLQASCKGPQVLFGVEKHRTVQHQPNGQGHTVDHRQRKRDVHCQKRAPTIRRVPSIRVTICKQHGCSQQPGADEGNAEYCCGSAPHAKGVVVDIRPDEINSSTLLAQGSPS
jgi:hypothetical protein